MRRRVAVAVLAVVLAVGLAACGKKGPLEPPPASAVVAPAAVQAT